uniref:Uncharacterized protein n=1 Tax=Setaria viridis TaxID=4556 RepID=A0A4U6VBG7_SETVI|nr:hypothetical protein SEVIR_3G144800v2 [Setaria viridis]
MRRARAVVVRRGTAWGRPPVAPRRRGRRRSRSPSSGAPWSGRQRRPWGGRAEPERQARAASKRAAKPEKAEPPRQIPVNLASAEALLRPAAGSAGRPSCTLSCFQRQDH